MYDLIGDIHGCADSLHGLLKKLDYKNDGVCYRHKERQVIFLGDFIDRGPCQRGTVNTAMAMVKNGAAFAVMGNHEFNALGFHTKTTEVGATTEYLRPHDEKNVGQHQAFLDAYASDDAARGEALEWFRTLPLWLDLKSPKGPLRVVHACWDPRSIKQLQNLCAPGHLITDELLRKASTKGTDEYTAVEILLKGKEVRLPNGAYFLDKDGNERHEVRIKAWEESGTFLSLAMGPETGIPDDPIGAEHLITYAGSEPPLFLGHYWLKGALGLLAPNIACLDYSVAKADGHLVAYQWDGEQTLDPSHFVAIARQEKSAVRESVSVASAGSRSDHRSIIH